MTTDEKIIRRKLEQMVDIKARAVEFARAWTIENEPSLEKLPITLRAAYSEFHRLIEDVADELRAGEKKITEENSQ